MPDDVPLEAARRRLTAVAPNAWEKLWGWEMLLIATVSTPVLFALLGDHPPRDKAIVSICLLATLPTYLLLGRPAITQGGQVKSVIYVAVLVALFTPAVLTMPAVSFSLFGLCSQCFLALPAKQATVGVIALWTAPAIKIVVTGDTMDEVFNLIVIITVVIFFSSTFGIWIEKITQQSRERASLIEELEASRAEVERLSAEQGAQQERERLAGEIHDTLAQGFSSIIMLVQAAQKQARTHRDPTHHLTLAVQTAKENLAEARALISALTPAPLDSSSLVEAMHRITSRTGHEIGVEAGFELHGTARPLPTRLDVVLIRALQESLANVRKHAAASRVRVVLTYGERCLSLVVTDDGAGFAEPATGGYGLEMMRARVEQAGGTMSVNSVPGAGTTVTVEVAA
ncbi:sensor histidine kinase [Nonomuraea sp. NN258]|uniref:sensor histidine kinase n=1 Tax=Nonomuraea antri TaxID=2730852 RepID=UPI0015680A14|nr:sensor histidine kinase [Nonomuraea antri]NRQ33637.1 sensor histidine kinase [Nonomuraea antri]